jgi:hypothetical protein
MKTRMIAVLIGLSLTASACLMGMESGGIGGVELGDGIVVTAEVVAIDRADRTLALRGPDGNVVSLEITQEARNFDQIKIGDQVRAEYYESVAVYIGKHGEKPEVKAGVVAARASKGDKPAAVSVEAVDVSAIVKSINRTKRTVSLELPHGQRVTSRVDKSVKAFDTLKVGDSIHVVYTEAIAISVEKP